MKLNQTENDTVKIATLEIIDQAIMATKQAAYVCTNPQAKEHFEYALALITESWIAEDGQDARSAETIIANVKEANDIFTLIAGKEGK